jgi:hypothetical protein
MELDSLKRDNLFLVVTGTIPYDLVSGDSIEDHSAYARIDTFSFVFHADSIAIIIIEYVVYTLKG